VLSFFTNVFDALGTFTPARCWLPFTIHWTLAYRSTLAFALSGVKGLIGTVTERGIFNALTETVLVLLCDWVTVMLFENAFFTAFSVVKHLCTKHLTKKVVG
jgi:hypothetical protein